MKILVLTDGFVPEHVGGISKAVLQETEELARRGHEVTVLTRRHGPAFPEREQTALFDIVRHPGPPQGSRFYYLHPLTTLRRVPRAIERLHSERSFDVIYVQNTFQAAALAKAKVSPTRVWAFHAPAPLEIRLDAVQGKYGPLAPAALRAASKVAAIERRALESMDAVFTRSGFMADQMDEAHPGACIRRLRPIPLMVDIERFPFVATTGDARARLGLAPERRILLTVRRLVARQGVQSLVKAMRSVVDHHPEALLLIAGKGYLEGEVAALLHHLRLEEHVRLLGFVPEDDLPTYYQAADLFVLPSNELEGFGLVTLEAMSSGTPVLATPVGANVDVVGSFDRGYLMEGSSPEAIAEGICGWLEGGPSPSVREAVRHYCVGHFSPTHVGDLLEQAFASARAEGRGAPA